MSVNLQASLTPVPLGPCKVIWDAEGANPVIIDRTKGGCHFKFVQKKEDLNFDQTGDAVAGMIGSGSDALFEVPMVTDDLKIMNAVTPGTTLYTNISTNEEALLYCEQAGTDMMQYAKKIRLEPIGKTSKQHVTLFLAIPIVNLDHVYDAKNPHIKMIQFVAVPDTANNNRKWLMGPESALPTT